MKNSIYAVYCISRYLYQCYSNYLFFGGGGGEGDVLIAQLVEVTDRAVLGDVVEVVSSNPMVGHKYFSPFTGIVVLSNLSISLFIINLYQFLNICSSKYRSCKILFL